MRNSWLAWSQWFSTEYTSMEVVKRCGSYHSCTIPQAAWERGGEMAGLLDPNGFQQNILAWKLLNGVVHITVAPFHKLLERGVEKCPWLTISELQQNIASCKCETVHSKLCDITCHTSVANDQCWFLYDSYALIWINMHNNKLVLLRLPAECTQEKASEIILHIT